MVADIRAVFTPELPSFLGVKGGMRAATFILTEEYFIELYRRQPGQSNIFITNSQILSLKGSAIVELLATPPPPRFPLLYFVHIPKFRRRTKTDEINDNWKLYLFSYTYLTLSTSEPVAWALEMMFTQFKLTI